mgnify:CR=1 FL=1
MRGRPISTLRLSFGFCQHIVAALGKRRYCLLFRVCPSIRACTDLIGWFGFESACLFVFFDIVDRKEGMRGRRYDVTASCELLHIAYPKIIVDLDCPILGLTAKEKDCWLMMASLRI